MVVSWEGHVQGESKRKHMVNSTYSGCAFMSSYRSNRCYAAILRGKADNFLWNMHSSVSNSPH